MDLGDYGQYIHLHQLIAEHAQVRPNEPFDLDYVLHRIVDPASPDQQQQHTLVFRIHRDEVSFILWFPSSVRTSFEFVIIPPQFKFKCQTFEDALKIEMYQAELTEEAVANIRSRFYGFCHFDKLELHHTRLNDNAISLCHHFGIEDVVVEHHFPSPTAEIRLWPIVKLELKGTCLMGELDFIENNRNLDILTMTVINFLHSPHQLDRFVNQWQRGERTITCWRISYAYSWTLRDQIYYQYTPDDTHFLKLEVDETQDLTTATYTLTPISRVLIRNDDSSEVE